LLLILIVLKLPLLPIDVAANATVLAISKIEMVNMANDMDVAFPITFFEEKK
jgi:hypothetical protein